MEVAKYGTKLRRRNWSVVFLYILPESHRRFVDHDKIFQISCQPCRWKTIAIKPASNINLLLRCGYRSANTNHYRRTRQAVHGVFPKTHKRRTVRADVTSGAS